MAFSCSSKAWCWNGKPKQEWFVFINCEHLRKSPRGIPSHQITWTYSTKNLIYGWESWKQNGLRQLFFFFFLFLPFTSLLKDRTRVAAAMDKKIMWRLVMAWMLQGRGFTGGSVIRWVSSGCGRGCRCQGCSSKWPRPSSSFMELVLRQWAHLEKHKDVPGREEILVSGSRLGLVPVCFSSVQLETGCVVGQSTGNLSGHCCSESSSSLRSLIGEFYTRIFSPTWQWQTVIK